MRAVEGCSASSALLDESRGSPRTRRSAAAMHVSQMYALGPAMSFATWPGGRPQNEQVMSDPTLRRCQTRDHQVPPPAWTICCTR